LYYDLIRAYLGLWTSMAQKYFLSQYCPSKCPVCISPRFNLKDNLDSRAVVPWASADIFQGRTNTIGQTYFRKNVWNFRFSSNSKQNVWDNGKFKLCLGQMWRKTNNARARRNLFHQNYHLSLSLSLSLSVTHTHTLFVCLWTCMTQFCSIPLFHPLMLTWRWSVCLTNLRIQNVKLVSKVYPNPNQFQSHSTFFPNLKIVNVRILNFD